MLVYSVIMFLAASLLLAFSIAIYRDKTNLIHSYHQIKVTDKAANGKAFGKALLVVAMASLLRCIIGLFGASDNDKTIAIVADAILIIGLGIGIGFIVAVQNKYNKGVF